MVGAVGLPTFGGVKDPVMSEPLVKGTMEFPENNAVAKTLGSTGDFDLKEITKGTVPPALLTNLKKRQKVTVVQRAAKDFT